MADGEGPDLERRLAALELRVAELRRELDALTGEMRRASPVGGARPPGSRPAAPAVPRGLLDDGRWLGKLGIALLLFGLILLFRYSLEQGWLAPPIRLAGGFLLAGVLLGGARRLPDSRRGLARVLTGGAIATLYITLFAGFARYALLPHAVAFAGMVATTALSFALAIREDEAVHSLVGVAGGFATPFLLDTGSRDVAGLVAYALLVLAGAAAVFAVQGWRVLLAAGAAGAWLVLAIAASAGGSEWVVQAGIAGAAAAAWWLPLVRRARVVRGAGRIRPDALGLPLQIPGWLRWPHPQGLVVTTALATFALSGELWDLDERASGALAFGLAGLWLAGAAVASTRPELRDTAGAHGLVAAVLVAAGSIFLLGADAQRVALAGQAWALHALGRRRAERAPRLLGHLLFAGLALAWLGALLEGIPRRPLLDPTAGSDLLVVLAAAGAGLGSDRRERRVYLLGAHVALLVWLVRELADAANGQALASFAWIAYAALLLAAGLRFDLRDARRAALATFLLVAGKLVLVDLRAVGVGWRIASFLGFGALLLALSYRFPDVWREPRPASASDEDGPQGGRDAVSPEEE